MSDTDDISPLEAMLVDSAVMIDTPASRTGFSLALMACDLFVPVEQTESEQNRDGGVTLQAIDIDGAPHVLLFTSQPKLAAFASEGTRFARAPGKDIFPNLRGAYAVLNPGPNGRQFTPEDIAQLLGGGTNCDAPDHVHGPNCKH